MKGGDQLCSGPVWPPVSTCIPQALSAVHPLLPLRVFSFNDNKAPLTFVAVKDTRETNSADLILKQGACAMT